MEPTVRPHDRGLVGPGTHARGIAGGWLMARGHGGRAPRRVDRPVPARPVVGFEQDRTGVGDADRVRRGRSSTTSPESLLDDLVLWRGDFDVDDRSRVPVPVLSDAERGAHARRPRRVHRVLDPGAARASRSSRSGSGEPRGHGGEGRRVAVGRRRGARAGRRDRRRRRLRDRRVRRRVRGVPPTVLQRRQLHVRPGARSPRPALPGAVLVGDLDRRRASSCSWRRDRSPAWLAGRRRGRGATRARADRQRADAQPDRHPDRAHLRHRDPRPARLGDRAGARRGDRGRPAHRGRPGARGRGGLAPRRRSSRSASSSAPCRTTSPTRSSLAAAGSTSARSASRSSAARRRSIRPRRTPATTRRSPPRARSRASPSAACCFALMVGAVALGSELQRRRRACSRCSSSSTCVLGPRQPRARPIRSTAGGSCATSPGAGPARSGRAGARRGGAAGSRASWSSASGSCSCVGPGRRDRAR